MLMFQADVFLQYTPAQMKLVLGDHMWQNDVNETITWRGLWRRSEFCGSQLSEQGIQNRS